MAFTNPIVGLSFTREAFARYVASLRWGAWRPQFIVVHNTSVPDQKLYREWHDRKNWTPPIWMSNLHSFYAGKGWKAGPHLFVGYDLIHVFSPLTAPGTHSPSWNSRSIGIETIGEFEREPFDGGVKDNLIEALAVLHNALGLQPDDYKRGTRGIHFHKEDPGTTHKTCPGWRLQKEPLVAAVEARMIELDGGVVEHTDVPEAVHDAETRGMTEEELTSVEWLQQSLNDKGFANPLLVVDGDLGPKTRAAVKAFQTTAKINVDGIPGPVTRSTLRAYQPLK